VRALRQIDDVVIEQHFDVRKPLQSVEDEFDGFELLALHDERMACVVFENGVIELRHQLLARPIPELKDRRYQADARHLLVQPVLAQQIERRRMRGCRTRIGLRLAIVVEQAHRNAAAAKEPRAQHADRTAAGAQDSLVSHAW